MKIQNLVKTTSSGLALFLMLNIMVGRAAANEMSSAVETAMAGDIGYRTIAAAEFRSATGVSGASDQATGTPETTDQ